MLVRNNLVIVIKSGSPVNSLVVVSNTVISNQWWWGGGGCQFWVNNSLSESANIKCVIPFVESPFGWYKFSNFRTYLDNEGIFFKVTNDFEWSEHLSTEINRPHRKSPGWEQRELRVSEIVVISSSALNRNLSAWCRFNVFENLLAVR